VKEAIMDAAKLTRVEVIDHRKNAPHYGRAFVAWHVKAEIDVQDGGRTLKVFVSDPNVQQSK
jgi:hypothetical protein